MTASSRVPRLSYFFPAHNEEANLAGLVEEALALRAAGISAPVLILSEPHPSAADACAEHGIAVTVCTLAGVRAFGGAGRRGGRPVAAHLKVDTGMHRQGCDPADLPALVVAALAAAAALGLVPRWRHLANSAGATLRDDARFDLVRLGIELYGLAPSPDLPAAATARLRPALALRAAVSAVRMVEAGECVSYGHRWAAQARTRIATLPIGYADGVRRGLSDRIRVRLAGCDVRQVGRVTMDQLMVDVGDAPVEVGEVATLLGDPARGEPGVREWSVALDTIDYEVTCGLSARLPRVHHHGDRTGRPAAVGTAHAGGPVDAAPAGRAGEGVHR